MADDLLRWYDRHRRTLPWRAKKGEMPDPYRVWLSEIMLQQTTVAAVKPYFERFLISFPNVQALAAAETEAVMQSWAGLGYYSRARNLHLCAKTIVERFAGQFPDSEAALLKLPGIGTYTAGAIAAIAFNHRTVAIDGNVERVTTRMLRIEEPLPQARGTIRERISTLVPENRPGDFAQALMDLGATICTPKRPACALCPWRDPCAARLAGVQETLPRKAPKPVRETRKGAAFVVLRADGAVLLRTRPSAGLLGGMTEPPTSDWRPDYDLSKAMLDAPMDARWKKLPGIVKHVFTHLTLELTVFIAREPRSAIAPAGMRFVAGQMLEREALPSVMRKVLKHGDTRPSAL